MSTEAGPERSLSAVFTVTVETRKGAFYFDRDGFVSSVASRIEGTLEGHDDIRDVTVVEAEPAAPVDAPSAPADRPATLREAANYVRGVSADRRFDKASVSTALCVVSDELRRRADEAGKQQ
jgi:hypothetical protein